MAKTCWALALCLLATSAAFAQAPRGRDAGAEFGEEDAPRGERGERGEREGGRFGRGGEGEGEGEGEEGGRFGRGGFGGFRRPNPLFTALDVDGDGSISKAELRKAVANLAKLDADGDGNITQEEAGGGGPGGPGGPMGDPTQMVDMAMRADQNGDGKLTADEVTDPRQQMMLRSADADGDGAVSREELTTAMEQFQRRMGGGPGFGGPGGAFGGRGGGDMTERMMAMDKNGDGKITPDEAPEQARGMLRQADADGNGEVDANEMAQWSRRMGGRARGEFGAARGEGGPAGRSSRGNEEAGDEGGARSDRRSRRGQDEEN